MSPVAFFHAFPMTPATICSEPVVAWAHHRGRLSVSRFSQFRLWRRFGTVAGADVVARRLDLAALAPEHAREGDAVLLHCIDGARVLGVKAAGEFCVAATGGRIHVGRFDVLKAWALQ